MLQTTLIFIALTACNAFHAQVFHLPSLHAASSVLMATRSQHQQQAIRTAVPPPPPLSMPVWSLSCPVPNDASSSMSIVTFATPVSVSSPKLWAVSLYKTSRTRCAFLGVERSGQEYNEIASTSSSVMSSALNSNMIRRKDGLGEGMLAEGEGAVGWRAHQLARSRSGASDGVGILQLLTPSQSRLVPILGKMSSWDANYNKNVECSKEGNEWVSVHGSINSPDGMKFKALPNCASYIQLKLRRVADGGDHDVAICEVIGTGVWDNSSNTVKWLDEDNSENQVALDSSSALYTRQLREEMII